MAISVCEVQITESSLKYLAPSWESNAGAVVDFWGVVRGSEGNREIKGIEYESHRVMAEHQLRLIAEKAAADFRLGRVMIIHRIGFIPVAEPSLFVRTQSPHRGAAFKASEWIIDELKRRVPIWKSPSFLMDSGTVPEILRIPAVTTK